MLNVIKGGACTLLQDQGRFGYQDMGITTGGALDEHAANWANRLLGNPITAPLLEITLGNTEFEADQHCILSLCGAEMGAQVNGRQIHNWSSFQLLPGDRLKLGWARSGCRAYLAIAGGFKVEPMFGSVATVVREGLGGLNGQALTVGDQLIGQVNERPETFFGHMVPWSFLPDYEEVPQLRVISGYQAESFSASDLQRFYTEPYHISANSDRMGFRLEGAALQPELKGIASEGISYGAIQVPADGQPIILLKDRQTLGGYPKLGTLLPLDAFRLSQCRAGSKVRFQLIDLVEAQSLMKDFYQFFSSEPCFSH